MKLSRTDPRRITGRPVTFHGYDGQTYSAIVQRFAHGVAVIEYRVYDASIQGRTVTAYVREAERLTVPIK